MKQKAFSTRMEETFQAVRDKALENEGKIVKEHKTKLVVEHGDWKTVFNLISQDSKTRVVTDTKMKSSHTVIFGVVFGGIILASILFWFEISTLKLQISQQQSSFTGWLAEMFGYLGFQQLQSTISVMELLSYFLIIIGVILAIFLSYIYYKRESFPEKVLMLLPE